MPFSSLTVSPIETPTKEEHSFKGGDEVALLAKIGSHPIYFGFGTIDTQTNSDSVHRLLHDTAVTSKTSVDEVVYSCWAYSLRIRPHPLFVVDYGTGRYPPILGELTKFNFY